MSYSILNFQDPRFSSERMPIESYVWDILNPNTPMQQLVPASPLCCLRFNRSINAPLFVIMIETNPQLIRSPGMCDRTTALARTVHARDILHISIPYGDAHVTTVASSGTKQRMGFVIAISNFCCCTRISNTRLQTKSCCC